MKRNIRAVVTISQTRNCNGDWANGDNERWSRQGIGLSRTKKRGGGGGRPHGLEIQFWVGMAFLLRFTSFFLRFLQ